MTKYIEKQAATIDEAVQLALDELQMDRDSVSVEVLEKERLLAEVIKVKKQELVVELKALKVDKLLFIEDYLNMVLSIMLKLELMF